MVNSATRSAIGSSATLGPLLGNNHLKENPGRGFNLLESGVGSCDMKSPGVRGGSGVTGGPGVIGGSGMIGGPGVSGGPGVWKRPSAGVGLCVKAGPGIREDPCFSGGCALHCVLISRASNKH